jgi:hypothetical protein
MWKVDPRLLAHFLVLVLFQNFEEKRRMLRFGFLWIQVTLTVYQSQIKLPNPSLRISTNELNPGLRVNFEITTTEISSGAASIKTKAEKSDGSKKSSSF